MEQMELFEIGPAEAPQDIAETPKLVIDDDAMMVITSFARDLFIARAGANQPRAILEALSSFMYMKGVVPGFVVKW